MSGDDHERPPFGEAIQPLADGIARERDDSPPAPYRVSILFMGGPIDGDRRPVAYPFPDVQPIHDPTPAPLVEPLPDRAPAPRVGIYRLARWSNGKDRGGKLVYRWDGWQ